VTTKTITSIFPTILEVTSLVTTKAIVTSTFTTTTNGMGLETQVVVTKDITKSIVDTTTQMVVSVLPQTVTEISPTSTGGPSASTVPPTGSDGDNLSKRDQIVIGVVVPFAVAALGALIKCCCARIEVGQ
jgi:hypothetical protein